MTGPKTVELQRNETKDIGVGSQLCSPAIDDCAKIRAAAYQKWEAAGCPCGDGVEFWLQAEAELKSANRPSKPK